MRAIRRGVPFVVVMALASCGNGAATDSGHVGDTGDEGAMPDSSDIDDRPVGPSDAAPLLSHGCADQQALARHAACLLARDEQSCHDSGGYWIRLGCMECGGNCNCSLFDDSDCVCTQASDCFDYCLWSPADPRLTLDLAACANIAQGKCGVPYDVNGWIMIDTPGTCSSGSARDH